MAAASATRTGAGIRKYFDNGHRVYWRWKMYHVQGVIYRFNSRAWDMRDIDAAYAVDVK